MAKHRAPRYVRTKKALAKAPVAAGATVVGFGVLGSPSQALAGTTGPLPAHAVEAPAAAAVADAGAPEAGYTVEHGDTIATIAAAHGQSWRDLYQRNVGVIGADPNLIFPGQVLHTAGSAAAAPAAPAPAAGSAGDAAPAPVVAPLAAAAAPAPVAAAAPAAAPAATARITNSSGDVASQVQAAANRVVSEVPSVVVDNVHAIKKATEHLAGLGHVSVSYLAGPEASWADGMRWRGLREAGLELNLSIRRLGPFLPTMRGGASAAEQWRRRPTTGVIAYNDVMAIGFIQAVTAAGWTVPGDVSVIGFDNIVDDVLIEPHLTTIGAPLVSLGSAAVARLVTNSRTERAEVMDPLQLPARLVIRSSTGVPVVKTATNADNPNVEPAQGAGDVRR